MLRPGDKWEGATGRRAIWDVVEVHHEAPLEWRHVIGPATKVSGLMLVASASAIDYPKLQGGQL